MSELAALSEDAWLVTQVVDALELSCTVEQARSSGERRPDELESCLYGLRKSPGGWGPLETDWQVTVGGVPEPVWMLPASPRKGWRYALESPNWLMLISGNGQGKPRFCVQLRSDYLLSDGATTASAETCKWVETNLLPLVGRRVGLEPSWRISRLDLAADVAGEVLEAADLQNITTRARERGCREEGTHARQRGRALTSIDVGSRGSPLYARLYDKTLQATEDAPIRKLWRERGYDADEHGAKVWRVEFEIRPELLRQLRADGEPLPQEPAAIIAEHLDAIWTYATGSWMAVRDQHSGASRVERRPIAPWWAALSRLTGLADAAASPAQTITRDRASRPNRERLLKLIQGALAGLAAIDETPTLAATLGTAREFMIEQGAANFRDRTERARTRYRIPKRSEVKRPPFETGSLDLGSSQTAHIQCALVEPIGAPGFEPGTSPTRTVRATRLRHAPSWPPV